MVEENKFLKYEKQFTKVQKLRSVYFNKGINPEYHQHMQRKLKKEWPLLHNAIIDLLK